MQAPFVYGTAALVDTWAHAHPGVVHPNTNGVHDREQWPVSYTCDFTYASEDLLPRLCGVKVDADTQDSDHQPLLIELEQREKEVRAQAAQKVFARRRTAAFPPPPRKTGRVTHSAGAAHD